MLLIAKTSSRPVRRLGLFFSKSDGPNVIRVGPINAKNYQAAKFPDAFSIHIWQSDAEYLAREFGYPRHIDTTSDILDAWKWLLENAVDIDTRQPSKVWTDTFVLDAWPFE